MDRVVSPESAIKHPEAEPRVFERLEGETKTLSQTHFWEVGILLCSLIPRSRKGLKSVFSSLREEKNRAGV